MKRINPFKSIYDACNKGNSMEKLNSLPPFPRYIDLELTNLCNFQCLMCPTGLGTVKRQKGVMNHNTYKNILDQITHYKTPVRLIRWGEPFLHPRLIEYVTELKHHGSIVHINTNGSMLDEKMIDKLLEIKLDSIKFSFQGIDTISYSETRNIDFFDELISRVKLLYAKRGNSILPYIHLSTTTTYETAKQIELFKKSIKDYVDLLSIGKTLFNHIDPDETTLDDNKKSLLLYLKSKDTVLRKHVECPEVFDKLSINWDGTVSACCFDYDNKMLVGDLKTNTLKEIWISKKMMTYRKMLAEMRHDELPLCSGCYDYTIND